MAGPWEFGAGSACANTSPALVDGDLTVGHTKALGRRNQAEFRTGFDRDRAKENRYSESRRSFFRLRLRAKACFTRRFSPGFR